MSEKIADDAGELTPILAEFLSTDPALYERICEAVLRAYAVGLRVGGRVTIDRFNAISEEVLKHASR